MKDRIAGIVRLVLVLVALLFTFLGYTYDWSEVYDAIMIVVDAIVAAIAWWKNNNMTSFSQVAQKFLQRLKGGQDADEAEQEVIDDVDTADDTKVKADE